MAEEIEEITVHCPKCNSMDIREKNVAYEELEVTAWQFDDDGKPFPEDYDTPFGADWEAQDVEKQYVCHDCREAFSLDELKVERVAGPVEGSRNG